MSRNAVVLKSNPHGLILNLDPSLPFSELAAAVGEKFRESGAFFKDAQLALSFRGRELTKEEELKLIDEITMNCDIRIACILDEDPKAAEASREAVEQAEKSRSDNRGGQPQKEAAQFYRGSLHRGQILESDLSILILGDVNPGAQLISERNIVVLGCCMGSVCAGAGGDTDCYAAALTMLPSDIRVAGLLARSAIRKNADSGGYPVDPKIAYPRDGHLMIERISKETLVKLAAD